MMSNRIKKESAEETKKLFELSVISAEKYSAMKMLTAKNIKIPQPIKYSSKRISQIRHKLRCSQKIFADIIGVTPDTISRWERGERGPDKPACRFLNVLERDGLSAIGQ
jgi:DNA-binding transcriptional regulator YiaG